MSFFDINFTHKKIDGPHKKPAWQDKKYEQQHFFQWFRNIFSWAFTTAISYFSIGFCKTVIMNSQEYITPGTTLYLYTKSCWIFPNAFEWKIVHLNIVSFILL